MQVKMYKIGSIDPIKVTGSFRNVCMQIFRIMGGMFRYSAHIYSMKILKIPSPLERLNLKQEDNGISCWVKRDDLIHPLISGNKWRKLVYPLHDIINNGRSGIITFGGAFSNHIVATAVACQHLNLPCVGIIRGEDVAANNPSLMIARQAGMKLHFVDRSHYRLKESSECIRSIVEHYDNYEVIPEGGKHTLALSGVAEIIEEISQTMDEMPDYVITAVGTGTTFAGLSRAFSGKLIGINVLKNEGIEKEILNLLGDANLAKGHQVMHDYHFGGYAKYTDELIDFMHDFYEKSKIKTDVVYTSKLFFAFLDLLKKGYFEEGATVLIYHSGGEQGNAGMNYRFPGLVSF